MRQAADSKGAVGKLPRYTCGTTAQPGQKYFVPVLFYPDYNFTLLPYTKMVKIAAIRSVFSPKIHQNAFAAGARPLTPLEELS